MIVSPIIWIENDKLAIWHQAGRGSKASGRRIISPAQCWGILIWEMLLSWNFPNFQKREMFLFLLILNMFPLLLCKSGEGGSKSKSEEEDDSSDSDSDSDEEEDGPLIIKQNHPRHCR